MIHKAKRHAWKYKWWLLGLAVLFVLLLWGPTVYAKLSTHGERYNLADTHVSQVPHRHVAIVFGAGLYDHGKPTSYLRARVETAVQLYKAKRVDKLLMTGDNTRKTYNEPKAMRDLALQLGVPGKDIVLDYGGRDTYDSCHRAHAIFKVSSGTVITQGYHLPRALMTCRDLGINAIGVAANRQGRDFTASYIMREWLSTDKAVYELLTRPDPAVRGPSLPID
ncbi:MAG TPA: ElyC/SanA/YdcF family protein [Candidatus Saccharimonadales bacterium]|nr:ElyC/SanA/YdcF family protein [Candidatus Saccharimonadales bacterium]